MIGLPVSRAASQDVKPIALTQINDPDTAAVASVPNPKFVSLCSGLFCELRIQTDTRNL